MICINKKCQACKSHFVNQEYYKDCYSDKEFIIDCETHERMEELKNTKLNTHAKGGH